MAEYAESPASMIELVRNNQGQDLERALFVEHVLTRVEKQWLFMFLWSDNSGRCRTCGANEGDCVEATCVRTRVTNRLGLGRNRPVLRYRWF